MIGFYSSYKILKSSTIVMMYSYIMNLTLV